MRVTHVITRLIVGGAQENTIASDLGLRRISTSQWCSAHDRPAFYSHRASRGADGRMVAYLGRPVAGGPRS